MTDDPPEDETPPDAAEESVSAADPDQQKRIRRRRESVEEKKARFWETVFADPIGRACMWEILQTASWSKDRFANGPAGFPDANATFFQAGQRSIGDALFYSWLKASRDGVMMMLDENDERFYVPKSKRK